MALIKQGYKSAILGVANTKTNLNGDGTIAQSGDTPEGTKTLSFRTVNAENGLAENQFITDLFLVRFAGGTNNYAQQTMRVTWEV